MVCRPVARSWEELPERRDTAASGLFVGLNDYDWAYNKPSSSFNPAGNSASPPYEEAGPEVKHSEYCMSLYLDTSKKGLPVRRVHRLKNSFMLGMACTNLISKIEPVLADIS
jgi:hypothetical protein